jgi:cytochrome c biogenesis protein CcmG/thiol:disulfide interchange protein DsbE
VTTRRIVAVVAAVVVVAGLAWAAFAVLGRDSSVADSKLVGRPVPALTLPRVEGDDGVLLAGTGTVSVINFWAPWCVPCLGEHELFNRVAPAYERDDVHFVGVVYQSEDAQVTSFLDRVGRNIPTVRDADGIASIEFGVTGVPETFFVDRDGVVRYRVAGPVSEAKLTELLGRLLGAPPA